MDIKIIYEDDSVLVVDKPAGIVVFPEGQTKDGTLIEELSKEKTELKNVGEDPRFGIIHRLDKDTSGILLVAKTNEALKFLQNQFINRRVDKKYVCLVEGSLSSDHSRIETLIGRAKGDKRKQKAYPLNDPNPKGKREAITEYKTLQRFKDYTLVEVEIKTGRRHQIRCHFSYLKHPLAGDKLYSFKNSKIPERLTRQFLHAKQLKIQLPDGQIHEFNSDLPEDLKLVINKLEKI